MGRASNKKITRTVDLQSQKRQTSRRSASWSALAHLPKHLHAAIVSYPRQADQSGDPEPGIRQLLDRIVEKEPPESVMAKLVAFDRSQADMKPRTMLSREWNGITQRAIVVDDGSPVERDTVRQPFGDRLRHHRHSLERPRLLWPAG